MFNVNFCSSLCDSEAYGKPVASQETATLLLPSGPLERVVWDHSRWTEQQCPLGRRLSQQLKSSSFQWMSVLRTPRKVPL